MWLPTQLKGDFSISFSINLDQELIEAKDEILEEAHKHYAAFIDNLRKDARYYESKEFTIDGIECVLRMPKEVLAANEQGEPRYYVRSLYVYRSWINPSSKLGQVLNKIFAITQELGFNCDTADFRVEKGCIQERDQYWHYDGEFLREALTVGMSNRDHWSTRILEDSYVKTVPHVRDFVTDYVHRNYADQHSQPSLSGHLYDVKKVFHRAPKLKDIGGELNKDDYRIFLKFTRRNSELSMG